METKSEYLAKYNRDLQGEKVVGDYLDTYFYPTWTSTISRNNDKATQVRGVDITVTSFDNVEYVIDEKAAINYANKNLQTFALEVDRYISNGMLMNGWLLEKNKLNDWWLFVWLDETTGKLNGKEDIKAATVSLIKVRDVYEYFHSHNIYGSDIKNRATVLREEADYYGSTMSNNLGGFKMVVNTKNFERGCNILIPRSELINTISTYTVQIKDGKVIPLRIKPRQ